MRCRSRAACSDLSGLQITKNITEKQRKVAEFHEDEVDFGQSGSCLEALSSVLLARSSNISGGEPSSDEMKGTVQDLHRDASATALLPPSKVIEYE